MIHCTNHIMPARWRTRPHEEPGLFLPAPAATRRPANP